VLKTRDARDWAREFNAIGVPAGAVLSVPEVLQAPQIADRGFLKHYTDVPGVGRDIDVVTTGVKLDGAAISVDAPPPELGQDNARYLGRAGAQPPRDRTAAGRRARYERQGQRRHRQTIDRDHRQCDRHDAKAEPSDRHRPVELSDTEGAPAPLCRLTQGRPGTSSTRPGGRDLCALEPGFRRTVAQP
jgi:hypothetical protein